MTFLALLIVSVSFTGSDSIDSFSCHLIPAFYIVPPYLPVSPADNVPFCCLLLSTLMLACSIEANQMEDRAMNKMWLVRHLEVTRQLVLEDLRVVKVKHPTFLHTCKSSQVKQPFNAV